MTDMFEEAAGRMREGPTPRVEVTPAERVDMLDEAFARLRPDAVASQLAAPSQANARGYVLPTEGWNVGTSILHGMAQGLLPEIAADFRARQGEPYRPFGIGSRPAQELPSYEAERARLEAAHRAYAEQNPGKALAGELGGSLATAIPAMAAGGAGLGALSSRAVAAAPWLSGLVDFLSGASRGVGAIPSMAARGVAEGTTAAGLSSNLSDKPLKDQLGTGAAVGAALGPVGGSVAKLLGSHVNKTTAETAQALLDAGIPIRAGQVPGSNKVAQGLDKVFGGGNAQQREAFAEKLTGHAGSPSKEINQEWVGANDKRIGKTMNDIQSVYSIPQSEGALGMDLLGLRAQAVNDLSPANAKKVGEFIDKIDLANNRGINGNIYKNLTMKGGILDNMKVDKDIASFAPKLREALDDAWGRALPPDKKAAWDLARKEYKITRVIDDSMGASGAAEGVYNPKKLLKAVEDRYGNVENAGELGLLARGGQFLEPPGAAPASAKHGGPVSAIGKLALAGAAGAAASEGSHVITHWGPEAIAAISQHPESFALPLALAGGLYGGARGLNAALNSPRATQYLLDVSRGSRNPLLMGNNPLIPLAVEGYNRQ